MTADRFVEENAFFVLGCAAEASAQEIERTAAKLLGLLELGASSAKKYATPLGERDRTPELVRAAAADLRDPERRILHELWARAGLTLPSLPAAPNDVPTFPEARVLLGWRRR